MSKSLPTVTSQIPRDLRNFVDRLRDIITGTGSSRLVSVQDLADAGVANVDSRGNMTPAVVDANAPVYGPPPAPTNVQASAAIQNIIVSWDTPAYVNHAYAEVWGADTDNLGAAVLIAQAPGAVYTDPIGPSRTRYYWVRFVNTQYTTGPYNATGGTPATTGADLAYTMDLLRDTYGGTSEAPFFQLDAPQVIGGVTIPAGTYMKAAFIYDGTITNAKIGSAAIDDAKVASLSAEKITTGYLSADRVQAGALDAKIANLSAAVITTGYLDMARINNAAITSAKIADATITSAKISDAAVTLAKIDTASIGTLSAITQYVGQIDMQRPPSTSTFIRYGKTSAADVSNAGFWIGVDAAGDPGVAIGGTNGLFRYTLSGGLQVAGQSVSVVQPGSVVASSALAGTLTWTNNTGLFTTFTLAMIGGGGGGTGVTNAYVWPWVQQGGGAGGNTTGTIKNSVGTVLSTYTANGGAGGGGGYTFYGGAVYIVPRTPTLITTNDGAAGGGLYEPSNFGYKAPNGSVGSYTSTTVTIPIGGSITVVVGSGGTAGAAGYTFHGWPGYPGAFTLTVVGA